MKYSEDTDEHRKANIAYIDERWKQLCGLEVEWAAEGIKYLLLVNAGAAVAVLTFHGSVAAVRDMLWPKVMLGFFVSGVVLVGVVHICRHRRVAGLFKEWQKGVTDYFKDVKDWGDLINEDNARVQKTNLALQSAYLSFACFVIGVSIGMFNFTTLTSGENNGRKETSAAQTISAAGPVDQGRQIENKERSAEPPITSTRSEKEMKPSCHRLAMPD